MKTLYLDCNMGATGEMLASALLAIHPNPNQVIERLNQLNLPGIRFQAESVATGGLVGTHIKILRHSAVFEEDFLTSGSQYFSPHPQSSFLDSRSHQNPIGDLSENCPVEIREHVQAVFRLIAEAKSAVCGQPIEPVESIESIESIKAKAELPMNDNDFDSGNENENGTESRAQEDENGVWKGTNIWKVEDETAIAEVIAVCVLMDELKPEKIVASPVLVGSGLERRDHGFFPIPSPEVAWMLRGVPTYGGQVRQVQTDRDRDNDAYDDQNHREFCDLTGASLLKHFVQEFGSQPRMQVEEIGYGFAFVNSVNADHAGMRSVADTGMVMRAMMGESAEREDSVLELCCNLDDMTPERIGFAMEELFLAGALDVYTTPIGMKKNRPAVLLTCMCRAELRERMIKLLFLHTTTLGIREKTCNRYVMKRFMETVETEYGPVRIKHVSGWGVEREKAEYDDLAKIARQQNLSISQVDDLVKRRRDRDLDKKS